MKKELRDGLLMDHSIIMVDEKKPGLPIHTRIIQLLAILLGGWGSLSVLMETVPLPVDKGMVYLSILVCALITYALCLYSSYDIVKLFFWLLFYGLFFVSRFSVLKNGFYHLENKIIDRLTAYYGLPYFQYIANSDTAGRDTTLLIIMIAIPMVALFTIAVIRSRLVGIAGILLFLPITLSFLFGLIPSERYLLAYVAAVLYLSQASFSGHRITDRNQKIIFHRINSRSAVWLCLICLLVFSAFKLILSEKDYQKIELIKEKKAELQTVLFDFNINNYTDMFEDIKLFSSGSAAGGLDGGKLNNYSKVTFNNSEQLVITAPLESISDGVYLKGYVGSDYTGSSWESHDEAAAEAYDLLMQGIPPEEFLPINQTVRRIKATNSGDFLPLYLSGTMKVVNVHANRRFIYTPYVTDLDNVNNIKYEQDLYALPVKRHKSYELLYYYPNPKIDTLSQIQYSYNWNDYANQYEERYRSFVMDYYTRLPSTGLDRLRQDFGTDNDEIQGLDTVQKIMYVKDYLSNNTTYSLEPGQLPKGKDYIEYFLYENRKGYCAHYATTAVMMLRAMGVPARYVEGYAVGPSDVIRNTVSSSREEMPANQVNDPKVDITVSVRDYNAHAWVEIYVDQVGWTPFDPTPGSNLGYAGWNQRGSLAYNTPVPSGAPATPTPRPTDKLQQEKPEPTKAPVVINNGSNNSEQNGLNSKLTGLTFLLFLAIALILLVLFRRGRKNNRPIRSRKRRAILMFGNVNKLLGDCLELGKKGENLEDCEEYVKKNCLLFEAAAFERFMEIIRKARFGCGNITEEEYDTVRWFYQDVLQKVYGRLSIFTKLYLKLHRID